MQKLCHLSTYPFCLSTTSRASDWPITAHHMRKKTFKRVDFCCTDVYASSTNIMLVPVSCSQL